MLHGNFRVPACWLEVSRYTEGRAIGHLDKGFLLLLCVQINAEMVPKFQVATT
jgi:hypothetical protein